MRGKRLGGRDAAVVALAFPGSVVAATYEDLVALYMNVEYASGRRVNEAAEAVEIGTGRAERSHELLRLICDTPEEYARWQAREVRRLP